MAEATALQAKMKLDTSEVKRTGTLEKGYKITGISGSGTLKLNKVTSYFLKKVSENLKKGKATRMTIITNLEDPEAFGAERIRLDDCDDHGIDNCRLGSRKTAGGINPI
ncbi:MAG: phage tail tube protein [Blautia wexlerae]